MLLERLFNGSGEPGAILSGADGGNGGIGGGGGGGIGGGGNSSQQAEAMPLMEMLRAVADMAPRLSWPLLFASLLPVGVGGGITGLHKRLEHELRLLRGEPDMPRTLRPVVLCAQGEPLQVAQGSANGLAAWPLSAPETAAWRGAAIACTDGVGGGCGARGVGRELRGDTAPCAHPGIGQRGAGSGWITPDAFRRAPLPTTRGALKAGGSAVEKWDATGRKQI